MSSPARKIEQFVVATKTRPFAPSRRRAHDPVTPKGYAAVLKADRLDGGWVSSYPALPGVMSQGETKLEALKNLDNAIDAVLQVKNRSSRS